MAHTFLQNTSPWRRTRVPSLLPLVAGPNQQPPGCAAIPIASAPSTAAREEQQLPLTPPLELEIGLHALSVKDLRLRAVALGVNKEAIEEARDGDDPKGDIIALIATTLKAQPGWRRSITWHKRCTVRVQRWLEKEVYHRFSLAELLELGGSVVLPQMDTVSDWAVAYSFYSSGDMGWFWAAFSIQIVSGLLTGLLLCGLASGSKQRWLLLLAMPIGLAGLTPSALAVTTLVTKTIATQKQLKTFKTLELIIEALPQSVLQGYVAISYGRLDPVLAFSIFTSLLGAGNTMYSFEVMNRTSHPHLVATSKYGIVRVLALASTTAMGVFWVSLLACAYKGVAGLAVVGGVCTYLFLPMEVKIRDMPRSQTGETSGLVSSLVANVCCGRFMVCMIFAIFAMSAFMMGGAFFGFADYHFDNNYGNVLLPDAAPGEPQHLDCTERTSGVGAAVASTIAAAVLMTLSLLMDPELGVQGCKGLSFEEQVAKDSVDMTREELKSAKVAAIWRWADRLKGGVLEPADIYRLAIADPDGVSSVAPEQRRMLYEEMCARFGISALTHQQLHGKEDLPAKQPKDDFVIAEARFKKVMLELMEQPIIFPNGHAKGSLAKTVDAASDCPYSTKIAQGKGMGGDSVSGHGLVDTTIKRKSAFEELLASASTCDACCRPLEQGARVHSCHICEHNVCHECFAAGGALGVVVKKSDETVTLRFNNGHGAETGHEGSFQVQSLAQATEAERVANIELAEYATVGEQCFGRLQVRLVEVEGCMDKLMKTLC